MARMRGMTVSQENVAGHLEYRLTGSDSRFLTLSEWVFAAGCRVGFDVHSSSFGVTPLVVQSLAIEHRIIAASRLIGGARSSGFVL